MRAAKPVKNFLGQYAEVEIVDSADMLAPSSPEQQTHHALPRCTAVFTFQLVQLDTQPRIHVIYKRTN